MSTTFSTENLPPKSAFQAVMNDLNARFAKYNQQNILIVVAAEQKMFFLRNGEAIAQYTISTSEYGIGSQAGSNKTPAGVHIVSHKYGDNAKPGTIFKARGNTGRIARILTKPGLRSADDNVTSRILWLSGLEKGINKSGKVDSHRRYIYIHGTDEEGRLGSPASHGCIRMSNQDVINLYSHIPVGTLVVILP